MKEILQDELLYQNDIKIQELSIRLNHIENILNKIINKYNLYWEPKKD